MALLLALGLYVVLSVQPVLAQQIVPSFPGSTKEWIHFTTRGNSLNPADTSCTGCSPSGPVGAATNQYVVGPTPPLGAGSLQHDPGDGNGGGGVTGRGGRLWSALPTLNGIPLGNINTISYSTRTDTLGAQMAAIQLIVDLDGDGALFETSTGAFPGVTTTGDAILVYEPIYNCNIVTECSGGNFPANQWFTWTITQTQGLWWDVRNNAASNLPCGGGCRTLAQVLAVYPNARVYGYMNMGNITAPGYSSNIYGVAPAQVPDPVPYPSPSPISGLTFANMSSGLYIATGSSGGVPYNDKVFHVDNFRVNFGTTDVTYDFEPGNYQLVFSVQPSNTAANAAITPAVTVEIRDSANNLVTSATNAITLAIGANPGSGTLSGTVTVNAVGGIATFPGISINNPGVGYTLVASAPSSGIPNVTSNAFNIIGPPPPPPPPPSGAQDAVSAPVGAGPRLIARGVSAVDTATGANFSFPGANVTWTYTIQNVSGGPIDNITARVTYPDDDMVGVSASSSKGISGAFSKGSLLADYAIGTLSAGETITLTLVTRLPNRTGTFSGFLVASVAGVPEASASLSISTVVSLPATGETPPWAAWLRALLGLDD
ncbi:MAG: hypothetical protein RML73_07880 [Anaerolineae bacterium]|nr:hypothetical protein [Anaerolineae bacterium]